MAINKVTVKVNGQSYDLTLNTATGKYEASITAPSGSSFNLPGSYYPVEVIATDTAGNTTTKTSTDETIGTSLRLTVRETVPPIITLTSPTNNAHIGTATPEIVWMVTDYDSGINESSISIKIDSGAAVTSGITKTDITNGYRCAYTPPSLSDGEHTIYLNVSDQDGNAATQVASTFTVDTIPPVLTITSPTDNSFTSIAVCTVSGSTNDATSTTVSVTVNGEAVTVGSNGQFTTDITLTEGANTITIVSTDATGKTTTLTRTVNLDITPPNITAVTLTPNPATAGQTILISVTVTDV